MSVPFDLPALAETFRRFARLQSGSSDLCRIICERIAEDERVLRLMEVTPTEQRFPMLLLAVVHDLLLEGAAHPLRAFYLSLGGRFPNEADLGQTFVDFCMQHAHIITAQLKHRATQTNEIGRVAALRPVLAQLSADGVSEIAIAEFGASAGLNLLLDQYEVRYTGGIVAGPGDPAVSIACELRGMPPPRAFLEGQLPKIVYRAGLDRRPVRLDSESEVRWLLACVWPDQIDRFRRTEAAIQVAKHEHLSVTAGLLPDDVPAFLAKVPREPHLCILTTWVLAYLSEEERTILDEHVSAVAQTRDLTWILAESPRFLGAHAESRAAHFGVHTDGTLLMQRSYRDGARTDTALADMHGHATWMRWFS